MNKMMLATMLVSVSVSTNANEDVKAPPYCIYADQKYSIGSERTEAVNENNASNTGWICTICPTGPQWLSFNQNSMGVFKATKKDCQ